MKKLKLELKDLTSRLDLATKKSFTSSLSGNYKTAYKGQGLEFYGFRKYTPVDDSSDIDWKASLRVNDLLMREYMEERNLNVFFLLDVSNTMLFGSGNKLKAQYAAELVASMAQVIIHSSDALGLCMMGDKIKKSFLPTSGEPQYYQILRSLVDLNLYEGRFDLLKGLKEYTFVLPQGTLFFIISDFIGVKGKEWIDYLRISCKKLDVIAVMVRDIRGRTLPEDVGEIVLESPFSNRRKIIDPKKIKDQYEMYTKQQEKKIETVFKEAGAEFMTFTTDMDFVKPMIKMFKKRLSKFR